MNLFVCMEKQTLVIFFLQFSRDISDCVFCYKNRIALIRDLVVVVALLSLARIWGECLTFHSPPAHFTFFFLKWRLARAHLFHSLGQDQSTVAQRAETTVAECSLTSCV